MTAESNGAGDIWFEAREVAAGGHPAGPVTYRSSATPNQRGNRIVYECWDDNHTSTIEAARVNEFTVVSSEPAFTLVEGEVTIR